MGELQRSIEAKKVEEDCECPLLFQKPDNHPRLLILDQTRTPEVTGAKQAFIYTKSPVDIMVAVRSKCRKVKRICDMTLISND